MTTIIIDTEKRIVYADRLGTIEDSTVKLVTRTKIKEVAFGGEGYIATLCGSLETALNATINFTNEGTLDYKGKQFNHNEPEDAVIYMIHKNSGKIHGYQSVIDHGWINSNVSFRCIKPAKFSRWLVCGSGGNYALGALGVTDDIDKVFQAVSQLDEYTCSTYDQVNY